MEKLKILRIQNNKSYQNMATAIGISKTYYWQLENNKRRISYDMAIKIANLFDLKPDDIFYDELKNKEV